MSSLEGALSMENMRNLLAAVASFASWRTLALVLALINMKNLPFFWHVSISLQT